MALGKPVSKFAEVLRRIMADERRETELAQAEFERAKGNMSLRTLAYHRQIAALDHGRQTYEYPNRVSAAIDTPIWPSCWNCLIGPTTGIAGQRRRCERCSASN